MHNMYTCNVCIYILDVCITCIHVVYMYIYIGSVVRSEMQAKPVLPPNNLSI